MDYNNHCCEDMLINFGVFNWCVIENEMGKLCWASPFIPTGKHMKYCPFCGKRINDIELEIETYKNKINGKQENPQGTARVD